MKNFRNNREIMTNMSINKNDYSPSTDHPERQIIAKAVRASAKEIHVTNGPGYITPPLKGLIRGTFNLLAWVPAKLLCTPTERYVTSQARNGPSPMGSNSTLRYKGTKGSINNPDDEDKEYHIAENTYEDRDDHYPIRNYRANFIGKDDMLDRLAIAEEEIFKAAAIQIMTNKERRLTNKRNVNIDPANLSEDGKSILTSLKAQFRIAGIFTPGHISKHRPVNYTLS